MKEKEEYYTKEDLEKLFDAYPVPEGHDAMEYVHLQMPLKDFFKTIIDHSSHHSFFRFNIERGELRV